MLKLGKLFRFKKTNTRFGKATRVGYYRSPVLNVTFPKSRSKILFVLVLVGFVAVVGKLVQMQTMSREFLQSEGDKRFERSLVLSATRGKIQDRNGEVLATSIPAVAVWAEPTDLQTATVEQMKALSKILGMTHQELANKLVDRKNFAYLKHQVTLADKKKIQDLHIAGVHFLPEPRRSYPQGSLFAHVVGFTNLEDKGIEGVELQYNRLLAGTPGIRHVLRDRMGRIIEDLQNNEPAINGKNIVLTIDSRVQYLTERALAEAIKAHDAKSGAAVVVDTQTGQILAMVSLPTYDPNISADRRGDALRNRAITDTFEPGSIMKPLVAALALDSGAISTKTKFNTGHGTYRYQGATITDVSRYNGVLDVAGILRRSSNIGMTMISERLRAQQMWTVFNALGFGHAPNTGFPGAASGIVRPWQRWRLIEKATMAYGYGVSVSLIQIAQAYTALARNGDLIPLRLLKDAPASPTVQVYSPKVASEIRYMLEDAAGPEGAKIQHLVPGYRIGGKSGTARQIVNGRYSHNLYRGSFIALAPIAKPRIVVAVTMDQPKKGGYYGSVVSGPVAAKIVEGTLRYLSVPPDRPINNSTILEALTQSADTVRQVQHTTRKQQG